jgi:uncharacterized membrane protein
MTDNYPSSGFRDISIDILRGFAITMMIGANMIPYLLLTPVPLWVRLCSSIAAPLFIFLSGMMVALSHCRKQYDLRYFLIRGGAVILIGIILDVVCQGLIPFTSIDVLYLIGISLPLGYLYISFGARSRGVIIAVIFCLTPLVQLLFGYTRLPVQIGISHLGSIVSTVPVAEILRQWFVDGWFPVFPWLGIALLGSEFGLFRWRGEGIRTSANARQAVIAFVTLCAGITLLFVSAGPSYIRYGYVELFYPPTLGFCFASIGTILCLFMATDLLPRTRLIDPFRALGECSLAIYILHSIIIAWIVEPMDIRVQLQIFLICFTIFIVGMTAFAYLLRHIRSYRKRRPFIIRFLIGG